ncbi:hypothetical protein K432DRAFT_440463 [Lepidopterella palustris CBS 459.81]|uniref:DUF6604 domain-containing protein n=1 Tax=Lepidopterella palustris CBS 459.81 TaxID=1314670 RepID=A0A8E2JIH0_9PEZI|nr:hypothetical protein K432DRAFT_440463 [Lepidopterella palustris CBS 459.81]
MDYIFSTFRSYKASTIKFSKLLVTTAQETNIKLKTRPQQDSSKILPLREMSRLATEIGQSNVPVDGASELCECLRDTISKRKEVAQFYAIHSRSNGGHKPDDGHQHFIIVLETAFQDLQSVLQNKHDERRQKGKDIFRKVSCQPSPNIFATLEVEEPEPAGTSADPEYATEAEVSNELRKIKGKQTTGERHQREFNDCESEQASELFFAVMCFFYDLSALRGFLRQVWNSYRRRETALVTAAMVTNVAFGIIKRATAAFQEELESLQRDKTNRGITISNVVEKFYSTVCESLPDGPHRDGIPIHPDIADMADLLCIPSILYLRDYETSRANGTHTRDDSHSTALRVFLEVVSLSPLFASGTKLNSDDLTISACIALLQSTSILHQWVPFGLQIFFDIQNCLGEDLKVGLEDLSEGGADFKAMMETHIHFEREMKLGGEKPDYMLKNFQPDFVTIFGPFINQIETYIEKDILAEKAKTEGGPGIPSPFFLYANHPVLSGLILHGVRSSYRKNTIPYVGWFLTAMAHLYNAAKQAGGLQLPWMDFEFLIDHHPIFVGVPPMNPIDFKQRFELALGLSLQNFASDKRGTHKKRVDPRTARDERGMIYTSPLCKLIEEYRYTSQEDKWMALQNLMAYLTNHSDHPDEPIDGINVLENFSSGIPVQPTTPQLPQKFNRKSNRKSNRWHMKKKAAAMAAEPAQPVKQSQGVLVEELFTTKPYKNSLVRQLSTLQNLLAKEEVQYRFNYLSMYRRCYKLARRLRSEVFDAYMTDLTILEANVDPPAYLTLLFTLFTNLHNNPKDLEQLKKVGTIMQEVVRNEGRAELDKAERLCGHWNDAAEYQCDQNEPNELQGSKETGQDQVVKDPQDSKDPYVINDSQETNEPNEIQDPPEEMRKRNNGFQKSDEELQEIQELRDTTESQQKGLHHVIKSRGIDGEHSETPERVSEPNTEHGEGGSHNSDSDNESWTSAVEYQYKGSMIDEEFCDLGGLVPVSRYPKADFQFTPGNRYPFLQNGNGPIVRVGPTLGP